MQNHASSLAQNGFHVDFVGYKGLHLTICKMLCPVTFSILKETEPPVAITECTNITLHHLRHIKPLHPALPFILFAPFKVLFQMFQLFYLLMYTIPDMDYLLVQVSFPFVQSVLLECSYTDSESPRHTHFVVGATCVLTAKRQVNH
jgi:beta-1,4-mannosyltransferase